MIPRPSSVLTAQTATFSFSITDADASTPSTSVPSASGTMYLLPIVGRFGSESTKASSGFSPPKVAGILECVRINDRHRHEQGAREKLCIWETSPKPANRGLVGPERTEFAIALQLLLAIASRSVGSTVRQRSRNLCAHRATHSRSWFSSISHLVRTTVHLYSSWHSRTFNRSRVQLRGPRFRARGREEGRSRALRHGVRSLLPLPRYVPPTGGEAATGLELGSERRRLGLAVQQVSAARPEVMNARAATRAWAAPLRRSPCR
jgi:hypothetical protein